MRNERAQSEFIINQQVIHVARQADKLLCHDYCHNVPVPRRVGGGGEHKYSVHCPSLILSFIFAIKSSSGFFHIYSKLLSTKRPREGKASDHQFHFKQTSFTYPYMY